MIFCYRIRFFFLVSNNPFSRRIVCSKFKTANKVFWQTIRRLRGKRSRAALFIEDSNGVTLKDQDAILNRWRDYFSDFLNPVDATPIQIHEEQVGEDIQITEADVNAVIKSLKTGKAPGEDDIRPEM